MELPEKRALSAVRYDHAQECFDAAKNLIAAGQYKSISLAYDMRTGCDYDDHYILSKGEVHDLIAEVDFFLEQIKTFIDAQ